MRVRAPAIVVTLSVLALPVAALGAPSKEQCVAAYQGAQVDMKQSNLGAAREKLGKLGTELTTIVDDTGPRRRPRVKEGKPKKGSKNRVVGSRTPKSPKAKTFGKKKAKKR